MATFPHVYTTNAKGNSEETVLKLSSEKLPTLDISSPPEFNGPEGYWSPETFFSGAIASCFILTFKAVARGMKITWKDLNVDVDASLDKVEGKLFFNRVDIFVTLTVSDKDIPEETYVKALTKAETACLVSQSIKAEVHLHPKIVY